MIHSDFVHLHVHTQYSLLDGACPIPNLIELASKYKMPAIAMTDHGAMFGAIEFYLEAMAKGIKPIIGCEVYIAPDSRFEKASHGVQEAAYHFILLVKDEEGYRNLIQLVTKGYTEGFYYKPRIDKELLASHSKGLIGLTSCIKGEVPRLILIDQKEQSLKAAGDFRNIFGEGNLYLELQTNDLPDQDKANAGLIEIGKKLGIPLVATNDVHYLLKSSAKAHEALLCLQTQTTLNDPKRMRFGTEEFYFKSPDEMKELFSSIPDAISNTLQITEKCNLELEFNKTHLPHYDVPEGKSAEVYLRELCLESLAKRGREADGEIKERLEHELKVIKDTGFINYFLVVWDFIHYAKERNIPVGPGRGSAAGSMVSYLLGITDIDPIRYGLLFERFLNPDRISMPDIDIDFCYERRGEVINYVTEKYGKDNVAQIITFGTMGAKAVIRDVGRVMGMAYPEVDRIAKLIPYELNITIAGALEQEPELKSLYQKNDEIRRLIDTSMELEGLTRHASTHAAGVVISKERLTNHVPLFKTSDGQITTMYPMGSLEKIGLMKVDFLGLRTLTVIDETLKLLKKTRDLDLKIEDISLNDKKTFELLSKAETIGIFQMESSGMRDLTKKIKPKEFNDIIALVALFRPGPMHMLDDYIQRKAGDIPVKYDHPLLKPILEDTYGIMLYQEQVIEIASVIGGFSLSKADLFRRAMGKKIPEVMEQEKAAFIEGATKNGIGKKAAEKIYSHVERFAGYGFNKCVIGSTGIVDAETGKIVTIKELFDKKQTIEYTFSCGENLKIIKAKIKNIFNNGIKPVYKIKTSLGREIIATANHPFFTIDGWKHLNDLCIGEKIGLTRVTPCVENKTCYIESYKLITLAGILSEGNTCHPCGVYYYNNDKLLVDDFVMSASKFDNTIPTVKARRGCYEVYTGAGKDAVFQPGQAPWNKGFNKDTYAIAQSLIPHRKSGVRLWIEKLGLDYKKANEKFIPQDIFSLDNEQLALFIGRLWSGDGFVFSKNNIIPFYATASLVMCQQIQELLLRFGVLSRMTKKYFNYKYKGAMCKKIGYALYLYGTDSINTFIHQIVPHIIGKDSQVNQLLSYYENVKPNQETKDTIPSKIKYIVREEKEKLGLTWRELEHKTGICMKEFYGGLKSYKKGFRRKTILNLAQFFESQRLLRLVNSDIFWDEVDSIEYIGQEQTYDLEIEGTHNFVANGIIVHNSHSAAYAMIAYETAYLKANYPVEFMAALLTSEKGNTDKIVDYIDEANRIGIKVLPPCVNESFYKFTVVGGSIRFGLSAVKNVGEGAIESIVKVRGTHGPFKSLYDFCEHVDLRLVNRKVVESLVKCGAFDSFKLHRSQLMAMLDKAIEVSATVHRDRDSGQMSFFDSFESQKNFHEGGHETPVVKEWSEGQLLSFEKEMLGFYITGHPLARYERLIRECASTSTVELPHKNDGDEVSIGGIISKVKRTNSSRTGEKMAIVILEDMEGQVEVPVYPDVYKQAAKYVEIDSIVFVQGRVTLRNEQPRVIASEIVPLEDARARYTRTLTIQLWTPGLDEAILKSLKSILALHPGKVPVYLSLTGQDKRSVTIQASPDFYVRATDNLALEIEKLLGEGVVKFQ